MNSSDYFDKLVTIFLSYKFIHVPVSTNTSKHLVCKTAKKSICCFSNSYIKGEFGTDDLDSTHPGGSKPGEAYGVAKVHNLGTLLRPVVSIMCTPLHGLPKFLDKLTKPFISSYFTLSSPGEFFWTKFSESLCPYLISLSLLTLPVFSHMSSFTYPFTRTLCLRLEHK